MVTDFDLDIRLTLKKIDYPGCDFLPNRVA
jgi:hypothetical protein